MDTGKICSGGPGSLKSLDGRFILSQVQIGCTQIAQMIRVVGALFNSFGKGSFSPGLSPNIYGAVPSRE